MVDLQGLVENIDNKLAYLEYATFFEDASKITNIDFFIQVMQTKEGEEKRKIEEGIIYLSRQSSLKEYEKIFLEKYHQYLIASLENDITEYYNNEYCNTILANAWANLTTKDNPNEVKFINEKSLGKIDELLLIKVNQIIEKIDNNIELDENERKFIETAFLNTLFEDQISKQFQDGEEGVMRVVVDYFKKYPIKDLSTSRQKQLDILHKLANRMIGYPINSSIRFNKYYEYLGENKIIFASYYSANSPSQIPTIEINDLDKNSLHLIINYLERMFTVFHELGHFKQDYDELDKETRKIIEMEHYLIANNKNFYHQYHDSFLVERDADEYAVSQLIKEYGEEYHEEVYKIVAQKQNKERIEWPTFYLMELEEYGKIQQNTQTKSHN